MLSLIVPAILAREFGAEMRLIVWIRNSRFDGWSAVDSGFVDGDLNRFRIMSF